MWKAGLFSKVVRSSYLLNGWGKEFWRSARGWTSWELSIININVLFFPSRVREFFDLHRVMGRTRRGVLTPSYFEPCNFPSFPFLNILANTSLVCLVISILTVVR